MRDLIFAALLALGGFGTGLAHAQAQAPSNQDSSPGAQVQTGVEAKAAPVGRCEPRTGSRIRPPAGSDCSMMSPDLRSYSQEDLERTHEHNPADALRRIDTRFGP